MLQKLLLFPFAVLYDGVTRLRNHLYDIGYKRSIQFDVAVICVGNLTVGGTGKTPHVEYLIRLLKNRYATAVLSRGYGRKTRGFRLAEAGVTAADIADEPMQFFTKFGTQTVVAVGERRIEAIPEILHLSPDTGVIILDDAFQHRSVHPHFQVLLSDYSRPFYRDLLLPAGRLRESRQGAARADVVVVSKCPADLSPQEQERISREMGKYTRPGVPVFFTSVRYLAPQPVFETAASLSPEVVLLTGIANTVPLLRDLKKDNQYQIIEHIKLKDHQHYDEALVSGIIGRYHQLPGQHKCLLTTEKDMVKLNTPAFRELFKGIPVFYLPIEIHFLAQEQEFNQLVINSIEAFKNS